MNGENVYYMRVDQMNKPLHQIGYSFDSFYEAEEYLMDNGGGFITLISPTQIDREAPDYAQRIPIIDEDEETKHLATYYIPPDYENSLSVAKMIELWLIQGNEIKAMKHLERKGQHSGTLSYYIANWLTEKSVPVPNVNLDESAVLEILEKKYPDYVDALRGEYGVD